MELATTFSNQSFATTKLNQKKPIRITCTRPQIQTEQKIYRPLQDKQSTAPGEKNTGWDITDPGKSGISCQCHVNVYSRCDAGFITRLNSHSRQAFAVPNSTQSHPLRTHSRKESEYVSPVWWMNDLVPSTAPRLTLSPPPPKGVAPTPTPINTKWHLYPSIIKQSREKKRTCSETNFMKRW